jgi:diguanylate cyclase (GGDEF)-like protein/PAS domain S-box-containing protein
MPAQKSPSTIHFDDVIRQSPIGMAVILFDGTYESVNAAYCKIYGYTECELLGNSLTMVFPPEKQQSILQLHQKFLTDGGTLAGEWAVIRRDGSMFHIISESACLLGTDGQKRRLVYVTDITERKRMEDELEAARKFKRSILDSLVETVCVLDENGIILTVNRAWRDFYVENGGSADRVHEGASYFAVCENASSTTSTESAMAITFMSLVNEVLAGKRDNFDYEYPCHSPVEQRWFLAHVSRFKDSSPARIVIVHENVTPRKLTESKLRLAASVFTHAQEGILITDSNGNIIDVNDAFSDITGYGRDEVLGKNPRILKSGRHDQAFYKSMWNEINSHGHWRGEIWNRRKNGEVYPEMRTMSAVRDEHSVIQHFVAVFSDIGQRKEHEQHLEQLAHCDPLTKLLNRRSLNERLRLALAANRRNARHGALMILDLDNFKPLNDMHGHLVGDALLIAVAGRLTDCVRETDSVARFGGDEFVVILSELEADISESLPQARLVAEKIRRVLCEPYELIGPMGSMVQHCCSASIGVVVFGGDELSSDEFLKWADEAMYQAKRSGRNQIRFYEADESSISQMQKVDACPAADFA